MGAATLTVLNTVYDGNAGYSNDSLWPPSSPGAFISGFSSVFVQKADDGTGSFFNSVNALLAWDNTPCRGKTVTAATLKLDVISNDAATDNLVGDGFLWSTRIGLVADYVFTASPSIFTAVPLTSLTVGSVSSITITDATFLASLGKAGPLVGIRLTSDRALAPGSFGTVGFAGVENTPARTAPQLEVIFQDDPPAVQTNEPILGVNKRVPMPMFRGPRVQSANQPGLVRGL